MGRSQEPESRRRAWLRRSRRLLAGLVILVLLYCSVHLGLILHPQFIFSHPLSRQNLTAHMREPIAPEMAAILDRAVSLLSASPLFDATTHHDIFIVNSYRLSETLLFRNVHFGCNLPNGDTFITQADVENDIAYCRRFGPDDRRLRSLSDSIAHEITHALIREHVGYWRERRIPSWIKEGYCEFVAQGSSIDHDLGLELLKSVYRPHVPGLENLRCRLLVEYLLLDRGLTVDEILLDPPARDETEARVLASLRADPDGFLGRLGSTIGIEDPVRSRR